MEVRKPTLFLDEGSDSLYDKIKIVENGKPIYLDITSEPKEGGITLGEIREKCPAIYDDSLLIKHSTIEAAGKGVFAHIDFRKDQIITYYQGPILSSDKFERKAVMDIRYKTHARQVIPGRYVQVGNMNEESGEWIVSPSIEVERGGVGPFINDPRDPVTKTPHSEKINVTFKNIDTRNNQDIVIKTFRRPGVNIIPTKQLINFAKVLPLPLSVEDRLIAIVATRSIKSGEELFINYGETHFDIYESGVSLKCLTCHRINPAMEEIFQPDLKFCDEDCRDNYYI